MKKNNIIFIICFALIFLIGNFSCKNFAYPSNAIVRVGIMDQKYTTTEKTNVTLYGTEDTIISVLKTKKELLRLPQGKYFTIIRKNNGYEISYIDGISEQPVTIFTENDIAITCPDGVIGIKDFTRGGKPAMYRGDFQIVQAKPDKFYLVNVLDVEYYLKGVVPCEMPVSFGLEALKSQAVAARVYSLTPRTKMSRAYDVVDSVASQVYNGYNRESDIANKAIDETHGIVALYNDDMIIAVFSSTAGGYTECYSETFSDPITQQFPSPDKPYLQAKPDLPEFKPLDTEEAAFKFYSTKPLSYDIHSPLYRWTRKWTKKELENVLKTNLVTQSKTGFVVPQLSKPQDFGELKDIRVTQRGVSGKIVFMEIETDKTIYTVSKELVIRRLFTKDGKALPSANVVFKGVSGKYKGVNKEASDNETEVNDNSWDEIVAYGGGFGHGCGLSQFGAMYMAKDCKMKFDTILKHYYSGICLGTKPVELKNNYVPISFYMPFNKAVLVIPNKHDTHVLQLKINDEIVDIDLNKYPHNSRVEIDISQYLSPKQLNTVILTPPHLNPSEKRKHERIRPLKMYIKLG